LVKSVGTGPSGTLGLGWIENDMKQRFTTIARDLDGFCSRINAGLTAVAILLGFLVMTMSVIRAQEFLPQAIALVSVDYQMPLGN
jgi:hypothetical protein